MLGSVIGDKIGSTYVLNNTGSFDFNPFPPGSFFMDDTVLTVAVADSILSRRPYGKVIHDYAVRYPVRGYGGSFIW
jgi:ADP-ribosylglycohydrolase